MDKGTKDKLATSPGENGGKQNAQVDLQSRIGGVEKKGKTQEEMERRGRKGSPCARSEEMERAGDRQEKMAGYCSTVQSPQRAVVLMEEEEEEDIKEKSLVGNVERMETDVTNMQGFNTN